MDTDVLKKEAYHSLGVYALIAGLPRLFHIPDAINAAIEGDKETLEKDLRTIMVDCVFDLPEFLLSKIDGNEVWKDEIRSRVRVAKDRMDPLESKKECIKVLNDILDKLEEPRIKND